MTSGANSFQFSSGSTSVTRPCRLLTMPRIVTAFVASRTTDRLTPSCWQSSSSLGRRSPGALVALDDARDELSGDPAGERLRCDGCESVRGSVTDADGVAVARVWDERCVGAPLRHRSPPAGSNRGALPRICSVRGGRVRVVYCSDKPASSKSAVVGRAHRMEE